MAKTNLTEVSRQWASRPDDERFTTLRALRAHVARRARHVRTDTVAPAEIVPEAVAGDDVALATPTHGRLALTHWSFGQLARTAGAPAGYLQGLPAKLAVANLTWGLQASDGADPVSLYVHDDPKAPAPELRAMTSPSYGRIYDLDVVDAVQELNERQEGRWRVPAASYAKKNPKRATTLYASDRDVYLFLCDPDHPVQIPGQGQPSYRGFIVSNSEVGSAVFRLACFLYESCCDNRILWGVSQLRELRIRHTSGAPERFLREAQPRLVEYANRTANFELERIKRAQRLRLKSARAAGSEAQDEILQWVRTEAGLPLGTVRQARQRALEEEGQFDTAWDAVQGLTALARSVPHTDQRVQVESAASRLLRA